MELSKKLRAVFVDLGRQGGKARAQALSRERRVAIGKHAAAARWAKYRAQQAAEKVSA